MDVTSCVQIPRNRKFVMKELVMWWVGCVSIRESLSAKLQRTSVNVKCC